MGSRGALEVSIKIKAEWRVTESSVKVAQLGERCCCSGNSGNEEELELLADSYLALPLP